MVYFNLFLVLNGYFCENICVALDINENDSTAEL